MLTMLFFHRRQIFFPVIFPPEFLAAGETGYIWRRGDSCHRIFLRQFRDDEIAFNNLEIVILYVLLFQMNTTDCTLSNIADNKIQAFIWV